MIKSIPGILLASGLSARFGSEKLLVYLPTGERLLERSLKIHLQSKIAPLVIVISPKLAKIILKDRDFLHVYRLRAMEYGDFWYSFESEWGNGRLIINEDFQKGISSSLRKGLFCLKDEEKDRGLLVSLADLPLLTSGEIDFFIDQFMIKPEGILLPVYKNLPGHPVIIDFKRFKDDILKIKGDVGLSVIVRKYPAAVKRIPWESNSVIRDIDNKEDLEEFRGRYLR
jgi:CTP:molybdopterin cytidylyltransferase MocA